MSDARLTRTPALDGLRGLAVTAVVVNHLRPTALPGGWLGVDVFFVLSGYLITSLLLREHAATGRVDLGHFYSRRARRLLPALFVLLGAVVIVARVVPDAPGFGDVRGDGFSALAYVANWHFVITHASYFSAFSPSALRHLWSLSIEEQFYLLWPLILILVLRRHGARAVAVLAGVLAAASAVDMALTYGGGNLTRAYFGTDAHIHGVLIGCALAALGPVRSRWPAPRAASVVALAGIVFAAVTMNGTDALAYRGGIAFVGVLTAVVIAATTAPATGPATWILERKPLRGLGRISYGVYLWHWPVLLFVTAARAGVSGIPLTLMQLAITLALALASFFVAERPVLSGWPRPRWSWVGVPAAATAVVATLAIGVPSVAAPFAAAAQEAKVRSADTATLRSLDTGRPHARRPRARTVVVVGDSVAYTLFPGLRANEVASHLYFLTAAETGCPLDISASAFRIPGTPQLTLALPSYCDWPRVWPPLIERTRPDVVVALWGLWDLYDPEVGGRWLEVGSPEWSSYEEHELEQALTVLTAHGARVVVLTTPYIIDMPHERVDALNQLYRRVAERRPGQLTVVDIQPAMTYLQPRRWDGVHFTADAADLLGKAVVPRIAHVASG
jgi:peptidoglycan/LPS O-acetylase OafA/YrhL